MCRLLILMLLCGTANVNAREPDERLALGDGEVRIYRAEGPAGRALVGLLRPAGASHVLDSFARELPGWGWAFVHIAPADDVVTSEGLAQLFTDGILALKATGAGRTVVLAAGNTADPALIPVPAVAALIDGVVLLDAPEVPSLSAISAEMPVFDLIAWSHDTSAADGRAGEMARQERARYRQDRLSRRSVTLAAPAATVVKRMIGWMRRLPPRVTETE